MIEAPVNVPKLLGLLRSATGPNEIANLLNKLSLRLSERDGAPAAEIQDPGLIDATLAALRAHPKSREVQTEGLAVFGFSLARGPGAADRAAKAASLGAAKLIGAAVKAHGAAAPPPAPGAGPSFAARASLAIKAFSAADVASNPAAKKPPLDPATAAGWLQKLLVAHPADHAAASTALSALDHIITTNGTKKLKITLVADCAAAAMGVIRANPASAELQAQALAVVGPKCLMSCDITQYHVADVRNAFPVVKLAWEQHGATDLRVAAAVAAAVNALAFNSVDLSIKACNAGALVWMHAILTRGSGAGAEPAGGFEEAALLLDAQHKAVHTLATLAALGGSAVVDRGRHFKCGQAVLTYLDAGGTVGATPEAEEACCSALTVLLSLMPLVPRPPSEGGGDAVGSRVLSAAVEELGAHGGGANPLAPLLACAIITRSLQAATEADGNRRRMAAAAYTGGAADAVLTVLRMYSATRGTSGDPAPHAAVAAGYLSADEACHAHFTAAGAAALVGIAARTHAADPDAQRMCAMAWTLLSSRPPGQTVQTAILSMPRDLAAAAAGKSFGERAAKAAGKWILDKAVEIAVQQAVGACCVVM